MRHCCTVDNRPGTTDTEVPRVSGGVVSYLKINDRVYFQEDGRGLSPLKCAVCLPEDKTVVKDSERHRPPKA